MKKIVGVQRNVLLYLLSIFDKSCSQNTKLNYSQSTYFYTNSREILTETETGGGGKGVEEVFRVFGWRRRRRKRTEISIISSN